MTVSEELLGYLKEVGPISEVQTTKIIVMGSPTGSAVFGGWKEGSDYDYLIRPFTSRSFLDHPLCYIYKDYRQKEFESRYALRGNGDVLNLLFMATQEVYNKWKWATDQMVKDSVNYEDKEIRVSAFEEYKKQWEVDHD